MSLSWDPVKAKDNESDVIGYMVMRLSVGFHRKKETCFMLRCVIYDAILNIPENVMVL